MQINVAQLLKWPIGTTRIHPIDAGQTVLDEGSTFTISGGRVRLDRIPSGILARGDVEGALDQECGRCLETFSAPLQGAFRGAVRPSIDVATGAAIPPPDDELTFVIDENHILDLSEAMRQNVIASLPINPRCSETASDCAVICGGNRNIDPCTCVEDEEDANQPFAALRSLLN